jgi:hypothetical protein
LKTKILILVTVLVAVASISLWYFSDVLRGNKKITNLIPSNSLGFVAVDDLSKSLNDYLQYEWWDEVSSLPVLQNLLKSNDKVDSLLTAGVLQTKINTKPLYISFHITSNSAIEPLVFIGAQGFDWVPANIESLANLWFDKKLSFSTRLFNDQTIYESTEEANKWGFIVANGFLVISPNSVLLEDVIRAEQSVDFRLIKEEKSPEFEGMSIVINADRFNRLKSVFTGSSSASNVNYANGLLTFSVKPNENGLTFSGLGPSSSELLVNLPSNAPIKAENFIPSTAISVAWFGISNQLTPQLENFNAASFVAMQSAEVCEIQLDLGDRTITKVLLAEVADIAATEKMLNELSITNREQSDTLFVERFMSSEIRFINRVGFFGKIYGAPYQTMDKPYYTFFGNVLLMSDKIDAIKTVLTDYEAENTWGRIPVKRRYVDNLIKEANITQIHNFEFALDPLVRSFNPKWKEFFKDNDRFFSTLENFTYQLNSNTNSLLVSAQLSFNDAIKLEQRSVKNTVINQKLNLVTNVYGDTMLTTKPFVVNNHNNNGQELIFQDQLQQIYLVDRNGKVLWKKPLSGKINGNIEQIDYYANKNLQYLMITDSAIHIIDRNGNEVDGFPKALSTELPILKYSVVDYDNSKNYRYATTDRRGNVYLLNKDGEQLEGWMPKVMGSPLMAAPEHVRIRGRDCFIIIQSNGVINLTTRKGEDYPGFPVNMTKRLSGDYFVNQGPSFAESNVQLLTEDGELVSIDFNGVVKNRNQLLKPSAQSKFIGVRDKLGTGLLTVRRDLDRITFFDEKGQRKFEKEMSTSDELVFEFYNFRNDNELYVIQNLTNGDFFILNEQGREKVSEKNFTKNPVGIFYYQNKREYELLVNFQNQMAIYNFAK